MAACDVCGAPASRAKNPVYTADEIRQLVSNGFGLDEPSIQALAADRATSRDQVIAQWEQKVAQTDTEWLLCPACAGRAARYRQPPGVERSKWWLVGMLAALVVLAVVVILIVRAPKTAARSLRDSLGGVAVTSVDFSPDGQILATGRDDLTVKLWNVATGQEVRTLRGHTSRVTDVAFSPDGRLLASTSNERTIKLWDVSALRQAQDDAALNTSVTTGQEARMTVGGHELGITSVAFAPDGQILASGSHDSTVKLWDVATGQEMRTLSGHTSGVTSVAFSPDGQLLASGSNDKTIKLWDVMAGEEVRTLTGHARWIQYVAFAPDGQVLASGSDDGTIKLWDVDTGEEIRTLSGHTMGVTSVSFSPDGRVLASGSDDGTVRLWDVATGQEIRVLNEYAEYRVTSVAFSPDGLILASGNAFDAKLWDMK